MKVYSISILFFCFLFANFNIKAQTITNDTKVIKILIFENKKRGVTKMLSEGAHIKYKLSSDGKVRKGTLEDIKTGIMVVDGQEIPFDECAMIAGRVSSQEQILGGMAIGTGAATAVFASAIFQLGITAPLVTLGAGVAVIVVGIILIIRKKHFNLNKNWEVHSGKIEYNLIN